MLSSAGVDVSKFLDRGYLDQSRFFKTVIRTAELIINIKLDGRFRNTKTRRHEEVRIWTDWV
ncbi:hypothetical protein PL8927_610013 [Planktothrix serta PCC 8927]|uniref:Transposase n=1 Tax=Planktothrix serta PCC 8927 TaxID=671068 RepID=A0A7Z9BQX4_9CYAN|nr:hypothetical protein PL8927_610013 [Planktothrix serta PCC 8927]